MSSSSLAPNHPPSVAPTKGYPEHEHPKNRGPWSSRTEDGRWQCDLCPRHCRLHAGQRGFCFVRRADDQGVLLESYGRASGFCVDPIEKKPLNHFYPGSSVLSFGTAGCNLGCRFCQNWDISKAREHDRLTDTAQPDEIVEAAIRAGCKSIAFTYNDPVIFAEYAIDCAHAAKSRGVHPVAVTAGYITEQARESFFGAMDAVNVDLKAFSEGFYKKQCYATLGPVLETLRWLAQRKRPWLEVTTLLIPGLNDSEQEVARMVDWFGSELGTDIPLHFTAFHPDFKLRNIASTPPSTLLRARRQALDAGLHYVYTGNVFSPESQSTPCPNCNNLVVERDGYSILSWSLTDGCCRHCGQTIAGHFASTPGEWGPRRKRLQVV